MKECDEELLALSTEIIVQKRNNEKERDERPCDYSFILNGAWKMPSITTGTNRLTLRSYSSEINPDEPNGK